MDKSLLMKIAEYSDDPSFLKRLEVLVADHARELEKRTRYEAYVGHLLKHPDSTPVIRLQQLAARQSLFFGPDAWVPSEYQTLEDNGLVHCSYGSGSWDQPRSRELSLTTAGKRVIEKMAAQRASASEQSSDATARLC